SSDVRAEAAANVGRSASFAFGLLVAASCSGGEITLPMESFAVGEGRFTLQVSGDSIVLQRDGLSLLTFEKNAFQLGVSADLSPDRSWDPWYIEQRSEQESDVEFRSPITWSPVFGGIGRDAAVDLDFGDGLSARVAIALASTSRYTLTLSTFAPPTGRPI